MYKSLLLILLLASAAFAQVNTQAECYFDTDPGLGNGIPLTMASDDTTAISQAVSITGLGSGLHRFYVRYRETNGTWGQPDGRWFWADALAGRVINAAECFYDTDPGKGNGLPLAVPEGQLTNFVGAVPTTGVSYGLHKFYVRYRESNGVWGEPDGEFFYAINFGGRRLHGAEYFFDTDPGKGNGIPLTFSPDDTINNLVPISVAGLQPGLHKFYIRYRNGTDFWGEPDGEIFFVPSTPADGDPLQATLSGAEYFINWDPGQGNGLPLNPADGTWDEPIEQINQFIGSFAAGRYWIGVRYRDSAGLWSNMMTDTFYVTTHVVIRAIGTNIVLHWQSEPGTQYSVFRAPVYGGGAVAVGSSTNGTLTDVNIVPSQPMGFYVVTQSDTNFSSLRVPPQNGASMHQSNGNLLRE